MAYSHAHSYEKMQVKLQPLNPSVVQQRQRVLCLRLLRCGKSSEDTHSAASSQSIPKRVRCHLYVFSTTDFLHFISTAERGGQLPSYYLHVLPPGLSRSLSSINVFKRGCYYSLTRVVSRLLLRICNQQKYTENFYYLFIQQSTTQAEYENHQINGDIGRYDENCDIEEVKICCF